MKFNIGDPVTKRPNSLFPPDKIMAAYDGKYEIRITCGDGKFFTKVASADVIDRDYVKSRRL